MWFSLTNSSSALAQVARSAATLALLPPYVLTVLYEYVLTRLPTKVS